MHLNLINPPENSRDRWCWNNFPQVCVGTKKKVIHIVMITEDNVYPSREISLSESPIHLVGYSRNWSWWKQVFLALTTVIFCFRTLMVAPCALPYPVCIVMWMYHQERYVFSIHHLWIGYGSTWTSLTFTMFYFPGSRVDQLWTTEY